MRITKTKNEDRLLSAKAMLEQAKLEGLSFYDANQLLLKNGFKDFEISQAAGRITYSDSQSVPTQLSDKQARLTANRLLQEQTRSSRLVHYWAVVPSSITAQIAYSFFDKSPYTYAGRSFSWVHFFEIQYVIIALIVGMATALTVLLLHRMQDAKFKRDNNKI